jgi:hypothetical protein
MSCRCGNSNREAEAKVFELLATAGLRDIAERTLNANQIMGESIRHLRKADRAAVLGYGPEIVALHRDAGVRANRACRRQFAGVIELIDERVNEADWAGLVNDIRREFDAHDGAQQLADAREDFRGRLLDEGALSASLTGRTAELLDETVRRAASDGLDGSVRLLRDRLERAVSGLAAPEMGQQPASPDTVAVLICVAGTLAVMVAALLICSFTCLCCVTPLILIFAFINIVGCSQLETFP